MHTLGLNVCEVGNYLTETTSNSTKQNQRRRLSQKAPEWICPPCPKKTDTKLKKTSGGPLKNTLPHGTSQTRVEKKPTITPENQN
jgi:hypothetical protein